MSFVYVDSSALVKLILREPESAALVGYLAAIGPMASSIVVRVEVSRAVSRVSPESLQRVGPLMEALSVVALTPQIAQRAATLQPAVLRTLDAIHLASALELEPDLTAFICYDERLSAAARNAGLPVVAPPGRRENEIAEFREAVVEGLLDLEEGREVSLEDARRRHGLGD